MITKKGIVTSAKSDKTAVVTVHTYKKHPMLKKTYRVSKKFHAHDEENKCREGDEVIIEETIPRSKMKKWAVKEIVKTAELPTNN
ncbi:MAG: 30S ribosomal protein S17 [Candidatus Gracilibacteria bacterium]|jgi:small subunit ribosomal protein S17|nr:30S ribosomal protein S17 [Candidatus Gracilibacteria bacterium]